MAKANIEGNVKAESLEVSGNVQAKTMDLEGAFTALKGNGGGFSISDPVNVGIELGRRDGTPGTPYIDFHTDGNPETDYNSRLIAVGDMLSLNTSELRLNGSAARFSINGVRPGDYGVEILSKAEADLPVGTNIGLTQPITNFSALAIAIERDNVFNDIKYYPVSLIKAYMKNYAFTCQGYGNTSCKFKFTDTQHINFQAHYYTGWFRIFGIV